MNRLQSFIKNGTLTPLKLLSVLLLISACDTSKLPEFVDDPAYNKQRVAYWKERAAEGDLEGMYQYGVERCCGPNKEKSTKEALELLCYAAKAGHNKSQMKVADIYNESYYWVNLPFRPVIPGEWAEPDNDIISYAWYEVAAENDHIDARRKRYEVADRLTYNQLARSRELIRSYPDIPCEIYR